MDLCRPRPGRNELGQEWKNNLNYVAWSSCIRLASPVWELNPQVAGKLHSDT